MNTVLHIHKHPEPSDGEKLGLALELVTSLAKGMDAREGLRVIDGWYRATRADLRLDVAGENARKRWGAK